MISSISFSGRSSRLLIFSLKSYSTVFPNQFAENSSSKLSKITKADQGQFSIEDRDQNTPYIKKVRVVTTVTYSLKD